MHESDQRAHNKHTTALSTVYKSLLVAQLSWRSAALLSQSSVSFSAFAKHRKEPQRNYYHRNFCTPRLLLVVHCGSSRNVNVDVIRRHRFTEEYRLFSKILGEIKRMRKQCIPGLSPAIEGLGTRQSFQKLFDGMLHAFSSEPYQLHTT